MSAGANSPMKTSPASVSAGLSTVPCRFEFRSNNIDCRMLSNRFKVERSMRR
ncbi:hypothetical protein X737_30640 [Mesorhizobium sp. L48C026A00]|nr:hypothetical protein X737_30640 [Mesorhizobium sp. L48C026A00]